MGDTMIYSYNMWLKCIYIYMEKKLWAWWIPEGVDKSQSHLLKDERLNANAHLRDVSHQIIRDFRKHR